ncbi:MAG: HupE/UreJ family protein [Betaproteobacteria bacterium]|uniref:Hydrogenase/urease accessory protein n=1 Tax=Serpentinimonas maccroryi TaxID=1458426 RepID=A0A060NZQ4_9BURK|nr:HupE/UreJ family protein [Serpentinimonas maccroryi]MBA4252604.1 urease accessory protein UreJ [Comamonadaceae bacterium]MCL5969242.1 HupE/UreJ family protein [Betaproteobacteria bacterium]OYX60997.1 MAG: hypothetical protein B7Y96_00995 [Comamonadaceae bacterium 32-67-11]MCM2480124.1 urease accessory protein UreJ [Serpentinimonas maccroryi]BAO84329.1 hydrogenase/urease accessory protein [Serpentinimonas maccroryi]
MQAKIIRTAVLLGGLLAAGAAAAHPGHGGHTLTDGLAHAFALDHLLAVLAVGLWAVLALPVGRAWQGPTLFLLALPLAALLGLTGFMLPFMQWALALSVLLFGVLLLLAATRQRLPLGVGLTLVLLAGLLHGLSHGFAAPGAGLAAYALGIVAATAALHGAGMLLGLGVQRWLSERSRQIAVTGLGGAMLAGGGLLLAGHLAA